MAISGDEPSANSNPVPFRFLDLSAEFRNRVYKYVFEGSMTTIRAWRREGWYCWEHRPARNDHPTASFPEPLTVSKQLRGEAIGILYARTRWIAGGSYNLLPLVKKLAVSPTAGLEVDGSGIGQRVMKVEMTWPFKDGTLIVARAVARVARMSRHENNFKQFVLERLEGQGLSMRADLLEVMFVDESSMRWRDKTARIPEKDLAFRFLDLPAELRNAIYEYTFKTSTTLLRPNTSLEGRKYTIVQETAAGEPYHTGLAPLLATNKQIRGEALEIFSAHTRFVVQGRWLEAPVGALARKLKLETKAVISRLCWRAVSDDFYAPSARVADRLLERKRAELRLTAERWGLDGMLPLGLEVEIVEATWALV